MGHKKSSTTEDILKVFEIIDTLSDKYKAKQLIENYLDLDTNEDDVKKFYIYCSDKSNMTEGLDLHLEKLFVDDIEEFIAEICKSPYTLHFRCWCPNSFGLLITNDEDIYTKYQFAINYEEFIMLCGFNCYDKTKILINKDYLYNLRLDTFEYFIKILVNEIVSASMDIGVHDDYTDEYGNTYSVSGDGTYFNGWQENKAFYFFKTPLKYKNENEDNDIFHFEDIKEANIEIFKKLLNINILEIGNNENRTYWEWRKEHLRYYDRVSHKRIYITRELLEKLRLDNTILFEVETKLDKNHYIEYHITGVVQTTANNDMYYEGDNDTYYEGNDNYYENQVGRRYEKYNGAYGLSDFVIDSALNGDPENYWNID